MTEIPPDILSKADHLIETISSRISDAPHLGVFRDLIAEALMEERERCATYHDILAAENDEVAEGDEWHRRCAYMHRRAAKFIRSDKTEDA